MTSQKPGIIFVPGLMEPASVFDPVLEPLKKDGYPVYAVTYPAINTLPPDNPTFDDDVNAIRTAVVDLADKGLDSVLVMHSAGGVYGCASFKGLDKRTREKNGQSGGVSHLLFLTAAVFPEGYEITNSTNPACVAEDGKLTIPATIWREKVFNGFSEEEAASLMGKLGWLPASGYWGVVKYAGVKDAPSTYLICENDLAMPLKGQENWASMCDSVERCDSTHMVTLTHPNLVVDLIKRVAAK